MPSQNPLIPSHDPEVRDQGHFESVFLPHATPQRTRPLWGGQLSLVDAADGQLSIREVEALNHGLKRAWEVGDPVCWVLARVRCKILQLTPSNYADLMGSPFSSSVVRLETTARTRNDSEYFTRVLATWSAIAENCNSPAISQSLREGCEELLKALVRKSGKGIFGQFRRWRYEIGGSKFDELSGISYKSMWARKKSGIPPSFSEVIDIAEKIGMFPQKLPPPAIWNHPQIEAARKRWFRDGAALGRPQPVMELHALLACCRYRVGVTSLYSEPLAPSFQTSQQTAQQIFNFQMPEWTKVAPVFEALKNQRLLTERQCLRKQQRWEDARRELPQRFEEVIAIRARERGFDNGHLAHVLGLRSPEREKPALPVFRALNYGEYVAPLSAGVFACLIGKSVFEVRELLELKRSDIAGDLRRRGSTCNTDIVAERRLWNLSYADLRISKDEIQKLEWNKANGGPAQESLIEQIRMEGERRARQMLASLIGLNDLTTIRSATRTMIDRAGVVPFSKQINSSLETVKSIEAGEEVPALPLVQAYFDRKNVAAAQSRRIDWQDEFARHVAVEEQGDLNRVLTCLIGAESGTRRHFLGNHKIPYQSGSRPLKLLSAIGAIDQIDLSVMLQRFGIDPVSPRYRFIMEVHKQGDIPSALRVWVRDLEAQGDGGLAEDIQKSSRQFYRDLGRKEEKLEALSLKNLIERATTISRVDLVLSEQQAAQSEDYRTRLLEMLPGVTTRELAALAAAPSESADAKIRRMIGEARDSIVRSGLPMDSLVSVVSRMSPTDAKSMEYTAETLKRGFNSPAFSLGMALLLSSTDSKAFPIYLRQARALICRSFEELGFEANELMIEMKLWGVRLQDLPINKKQLQKVIWNESATPSERESVVKIIHGLVHQRIQQGISAFDKRLRQSEPLKVWVAHVIPVASEHLAQLRVANLSEELADIRSELPSALKLEDEKPSQEHGDHQSSADSSEPVTGESWRITPEISRFPFEQKLALLEHLLISKKAVSDHDLKIIFPECAPLMERLRLNFERTGRAGQLGWYVASAVFFEDPQAALSRIEQSLRDGLVAKYPGEIHYENLKNSLAQMTRRTHLSVGSMGLGFGTYAYKN